MAGVDAEYKALESAPAGQSVTWRDERTGRSGTVTASQPYRVGSQDCRPYSHTISASAGGTRTSRGTACRNPDGSWTLLE
jgi:surface antigen